MQVPARIASRKSGQVLEGEKEGNLPPAPVIPFPGACLPMVNRYSKVTHSAVASMVIEALAWSPLSSVTTQKMEKDAGVGGRFEGGSVAKLGGPR